MPKMSPDEEFKVDWENFVKSFLPRKFKRFDYEEKRDGVSSDMVQKAVEAIEKGDAFLFIDYLDGIFYESTYEPEYDAYHQCLEEFSKEWEDPAEVKEGMQRESWFQDRFNEIYEEREENNWWYLIEGTNLLVWNTSCQFSLGWSDFPQDVATELKENPELDKFDRLAGLSPKQFAELVNNGMDMDVQGWIGIITDAGDLLKAMIEGVERWDLLGNRSVEMIVALHNGLEGSGYFVRSTPTIGLDINKPMKVDFGSYSLGDVFGTDEWRWH